jgi:maltoporin
MDSAVVRPHFCGLKFTLVVGLALLTTDALFAQNADQNSLDALKAQMNQMQRQYEQRIEAMEAKMKSLEANQGSGSIPNTHVLTDANGVAEPGKAPAPMLDESFLKALTRNFTFNMYCRAGFIFNGNGGAGTFNFEAPDNPGGRWRLGNENDPYVESTFNQAHILGDSPDVADVSFRVTLEFGGNVVFHESFLTTGNTGFSGTGSDFHVGMREAYSEMKNVFHAAPEITFWAGQRFYERWDYHSNDWFWLDTSGFGVGAYNIHIGPGNLYLAWIGANHDTLNLLTNANQSNSIGDQFEQTFDVRYKDIDFLCGKLNLIAIGNYIKGGVVTPNGGQTFTNVLGATDTVNVSSSDAYGAGGGIIWQYYVPGNKSFFRLWGLFGWGVTNFSAENLGNSIGAFEQGVNGLVTGKSEPNVHLISPAVSSPARASLTTGVVTPGVTSNAVYRGSINPYPDSHQYRAGIEWVWNVTDCFSYDLWAYWDENNVGFNLVGTNAAGRVFTAAKTRDFFGVGFRPVYWLWDNFAIQGQAGYGYVSNVRGYSGTGTAFGNHGNWGILTIAPTIKPKGGYFTRPEIRIFATWSRWSNSLRGTTTPQGEGGNFGPSSAPYNSVHTNQGWLIGSQLEIWF